MPALAKLLEARDQLANLLRYMDGKVDAEARLKKLLSDPELLTALSHRNAAAEDAAKSAETDADGAA